MAAHYSTLLIGGSGTIGSGLRTYLPRLDARYHIVSLDLPGARDKANEDDAQRAPLLSLTCVKTRKHSALCWPITISSYTWRARIRCRR